MYSGDDPRRGIVAGDPLEPAERQARLLARLAPGGRLGRLGAVAAPGHGLEAPGPRVAARVGPGAELLDQEHGVRARGSNGSTVTASPLVKTARSSASDMPPSKRRWRSRCSSTAKKRA